MLDRRHAGRLRKGDNLLTGEWEWGEEPNHTTPRKPDPLLYWRSFDAYLRSIAIVEPELSIDNHFC
jgi:hypothetical protein